MKKRFYKLFIAIFAVAALAFAFTACNKDTEPDPVKYTVTYAAGGAAGTAPASGEYAAGETFSLPQATGLSKEDCVFGKWNDGTGDFAAGATYTMPAANVTFTATWVAAHTVTFTTGFQADATTGPASQKYAEGDTVTLPENTFVQKEDYQNYIFTGWKVGTNTNLYQPGATFVMPAQDVTVQAQWTEGKSIAFDLDGGTGNVPATKYYAKGSSVTLPTQQGLSKLGYTLTGWKCNDEDETVYNLGASYTVGNYDATFTAVWKAASGQKHTVTVFKSYIDSQINSVEGTAPSYEAMEAGETFTLPETGLTLAHYRLTKWFVYIYEIDERDGSGYWAQQPGGYAPGATVTMPDCNIQLKAQWQANSVTISFDANGGTGTMTPITKTYGNTLSLPANGFTAPADKTFQGWSDTANGSVLGNGEKLVEPLVKADDTVTLYAIWQSQAQTVTIDGMLGHWTGTAHTLDIVKDGADENVSGYAVLDDKYLLQVYEAGGTFYAASFDYEEYYTVTLSGTSLSLKPYIGAAITLTEKSALTSANRGVFAGKWKKNDSTNQPWVITETAVAYNKSLTAGNSITIGDNIVMWYEVSEQYSVYVLRKSGDNLVGYYDANEKAPTDVTFVAGDYLVLYVDGVPNQIVNSGSAPDANKIKTPEAPEEGKTFDKWVLADNETEFDATATMTADAYIVATWKEGESGTVFKGRYVHTAAGGFIDTKSYTIVEFVLSDDCSKLTFTFDNDTSVTVTLTDESSSSSKPNNYGDDASYYSFKIEKVAHYILVNADGTKLWVCDKDDEPLAEFSTSDGGDSGYDFVTVDITSMFGKKFISETPVIGSYICIEIASHNVYGYNIKLKTSAESTLGRSFYPEINDLTPRTTFTGNYSTSNQDIFIGFLQRDGKYVLVVTSLLDNNGVEQLSAPVELTEVS